MTTPRVSVRRPPQRLHPWDEVEREHGAEESFEARYPTTHYAADQIDFAERHELEKVARQLGVLPAHMPTVVDRARRLIVTGENGRWRRPGTRTYLDDAALDRFMLRQVIEPLEEELGAAREDMRGLVGSVPAEPETGPDEADAVLRDVALRSVAGLGDSYDPSAPKRRSRDPLVPLIGAIVGDAPIPGGPLPPKEDDEAAAEQERRAFDKELMGVLLGGGSR